MKTFTLGLIVLVCIFGYTPRHSDDPRPLAVSDSIFIHKTLWPDTEKDDLIVSRNGEWVSVYTVYTADGSSLEFLFSSGDITEGFDCFEAYNASADGAGYLFYKRPENRLYVTYGIYQEFDPVPESVDFVKKEVLLKNRHSDHVPGDTLDTGNQTGYFVNSGDIMRVGFKEVLTLP